MGLQVWLPLNKDIRNVGLTNVNVTNNGVTLTTGGIYGNCCLFNGSSDLMFATPVSLSSTGHSICCWLDLTNINSTQYFLGFGTGGIRYGSGDNSFLYFYNGEALTWTYTKVNRFVHIAFVCNSNSVKLYVDGTQIGNAKSLSNGPNTCTFVGKRNDGYYYNGKMNDFRIYDHALSEEDVKRIYQQKLFELVPYSGVKDVLFDRSGFMNMPLVNSNAVFQNNALYFNGSAKLRPKEGNVGFTMDDGTLSVWFTIETASTNYQIIYIDSVSKFAIGISKSSNTIITTCNGTGSKTKFAAASIKYDGSINNIIVSYNTGKTPQFMLINGVSVGTNGTDVWTETSGLTIGGRMYVSAQSGFKGKLLKVGTYNRQFTQDEAVELYNSERGMFLPDDYIQLEYIQSTGTQWIDSGVKANQDTVVEIEFEITGNETGNGAVFGARANSSSKCFDVWTKCGNGKIGCQVGNSGSKNCNTTQEANIIYKLKTSNGNITVNGDSVNFTPVSDFETPLNVRIFDIANGNTSSSGTSNRILIGKVYSFKLYESNIIIRNMIPSKRKSDNVIGMYDMVSRQFFTNAGSGSFTGA